MKYKERLLQSQEEKDQVQADYRNDRAKLELQANLLETQSELAAAEEELESLKSQAPLPVSAIVDKINDIESLKGGLKILESLAKELF